MDVIYSSTALATRQREVKNAARDRIVRITENGEGAYVFASDAAFEAYVAQQRDEAAYEARMEYVLQRSRVDFANGRYVEGLDALKSAVTALSGDD